MKGSDPTKATESETAKLAKTERPAPAQEKGGKGKEKADEAEEVAGEDDDDAAWLERRRKAALGDAGEESAAVETVSRVTIPRATTRRLVLTTVEHPVL